MVTKVNKEITVPFDRNFHCPCYAHNENLVVMGRIPMPLAIANKNRPSKLAENTVFNFSRINDCQKIFDQLLIPREYPLRTNNALCAGFAVPWP